MRRALVSEWEAPTAAKAAKMASTSVNCMVREVGERKVLGWVCWEDLSGRGPSNLLYNSPAVKQDLDRSRAT
jgi:hypothetical protein